MFAWWHGVTSRKTWIFHTTTVRVSVLAVESCAPLAKLVSEIIHSKRYCKNYDIPLVSEISKSKFNILIRFMMVFYRRGHISVSTIEVKCLKFKNECIYMLIYSRFLWNTDMPHYTGFYPSNHHHCVVILWNFRQQMQMDQIKVGAKYFIASSHLILIMMCSLWSQSVGKWKWMAL